MQQPFKTSTALAGVRYEIRGRLANQAHEMERRGYEIISLNIGNPGRFGFRAPETMRLALIENLRRLADERPELIAGDFAVLMEPSNGVVEAGCQGTMRVEVRTTGTRSHSARAIAIAPLDPSAPGESMISAPNSAATWRRSMVTLSGITRATR